jgi:DNA mismatch repair ATPase MutS
MERDMAAIAGLHERDARTAEPMWLDTVHFSERVESTGLVFDYRLREGPARTRNAIALLEVGGAPPEVVERARLRAAALDARTPAQNFPGADSGSQIVSAD